MATNTVPCQQTEPLQQVLKTTSDDLLTAQIMAGSLARLVNLVIDEGGGNEFAWDSLNAALACIDKISQAASHGLEAVEQLEAKQRQEQKEAT